MFDCREWMLIVSTQAGYWSEGINRLYIPWVPEVFSSYFLEPISHLIQNLDQTDLTVLAIGWVLSEQKRSIPEALRVCHYKDLTETRNCAWKVPGTQSRLDTNSLQKKPLTVFSEISVAAETSIFQ